MLLTAVFANPALRPSAYFDRTFTQEQWDHPEQCRGTYLLVPYGPQEGDLDVCKMPPLYRKPSDAWKQSNSGFVHLLGTDSGGRDVLVQLVYGTRIALTVGIVAVSIYIVIGIVVGALAGYFGGAIDIILSRLIEIVLLFPTFFLILTLVGLLGNKIAGTKIYLIMLVIGLTNWPTIARLTRGEVLKQRALDYTTSAQALGARSGRIIFRHILPNALAPAMVAIPFGIANAIVIEAGLSLLGIRFGAADAELGLFVKHRQRQLRPVVARGISVGGDFYHGDRVQSCWQRIARCDGSAVEDVNRWRCDRRYHRRLYTAEPPDP